jgi:glycogen debranching enzyme
VEPLAGFAAEPFAGVYVGRSRVRDGRIESTLLVERRRYVGDGMREDLVVRNFGTEPAGVAIAIEVASDFANLFAVKLGHPPEDGGVRTDVELEEWRASVRHGMGEQGVCVRAPGAMVTVGAVSYRAVIPPHGDWSTSIEVVTTVDGRAIPGRFPLDNPVDRAAPARRIAEWRRRSPSVRAGSLTVAATVTRSEDDLSALRLADPSDPGLTVIAAGAPWFMALFGRDSLLTSSMMLAITPELAADTLRALARYQGRVVDPMTEEEPGRILHELRFGADASLALGGADRYFGTADATPLFVMVLGQLARWGAAPEVVEELLPAADRALDWIVHYGDRDGDGFVEYLRATDRGLRHQGWKDSADGINYADGTVAQPPIALVEVQAYVYGAYRARSELAAGQGDVEGARHWREQADRLKQRINREFWMADRGYYAVGLDADKRPIDALTSNIGHVLWAGAAEPEQAAKVADWLLSPELFTGYGIRTLASTMGAYNPASYHNGSVWPHDTALAVAGLMRYGFVEHAKRVAAGLFEAASFFSGRLPELFCGLDKASVPGPVPYPASCSPQAWASAAPVAVLTAMLGLSPDLRNGVIHVAPALPPEWGAVSVADIPVGKSFLSIEVDADGRWTTSGAEGLVVSGPSLIGAV